MQSRPSITYTQLQTIMADTVKRGPFRSLQGDRDHTANINQLIQQYINLTKKNRVLPSAIQSQQHLQSIREFHQFTTEFNAIMQAPA